MRELGVVQRQGLGGKLEVWTPARGPDSNVVDPVWPTSVRRPPSDAEVDGRRGGAAGRADLGVVLEQHEVGARAVLAQHLQRGGQHCGGGVH